MSDVPNSSIGAVLSRPGETEARLWRKWASLIEEDRVKKERDRKHQRSLARDG